jgi:hypothetical protein
VTLVPKGLPVLLEPPEAQLDLKVKQELLVLLVVP